MGALPAPRPLHAEGGLRFIAHVIRPADIPTDLRASMMEVWDALLHWDTLNVDLLPDNLTDRFLAQYLGRSPRFVQKGLHALHHGFERVFRGKPTGEHVPGIIVRHSGKGYEGRRVIQIVGRLAGRKEQGPAARPGTSASKGPAAKPGPSMIPNVGAVRPTSPEHVAAAVATNADIAAGVLPELTPEEQATADRILEESRRRREAEAKRREAEARKERPKVELDPGPGAPARTLQAILGAAGPGIRIVPEPDDSS